MWYKIALIITFSGMLWAQDAPEQGKNLFNQRCAACHKLEKKLIGPPLARIGERRSEEWFLKFVSNSQALIQSGDAQAVAIFKEYNQQIMPPFTDLSESDIKAIWTYLNSVAAPQAPTAAASGAATSAESSDGIYPGEKRPMKVEDFNLLRHTFWLLTGFAVMVSLLLAVIINFVSIKKASESS